MVKFPTTLIIGLGGVGSEITAEIYRKFLSTNPTDIEKRNIFCLALDTDATDVEKRKKILPEGWVVKTSSQLSCTVGDYINQIKDETSVLDWFNTSSKRVMNMSLNEGAGQIRMCSRLALMSAMSDNKLSAIDNAISSLLRVEPERHEGNDLKIHIICSVAGGTGAGSFLQTAYYVKDIMRNEMHVSNPTITGYFILADVLCNDRALGFNETQKENTRSNTYACLKELDAFIHHDRVQVIRPIEFEYKLGQKDKYLPKGAPYDHCYLIDFTTREGQNLSRKEQYYSQVEEYVYLNVFTDIGGSTRSKLINDIRQQVENDGEGAYSAIGISKLVYPVDDLFAYFANQKLVDNLNVSWLVIDEFFKKQWMDYKKKMNYGEKTTEPDRGTSFIDNVQKLAKNGTGLQKTIFNNIYNSTGVLDAEGVRIRPKSADYLAAMEKHVEDTINGNDKFQKLYEECQTDMGSFLTENDETNDVESIKEREENLERFRKYAKDLVDKLKASTIKDCFLASHDEATRVSAVPDESKHQLNTYILEKNHEMHPLAARYFLYEVRQNIRQRLTSLKEEVEDYQSKIGQYQDNFDVIDDKNDADNEYKENAEEMMGITYEKNNAFYKKFWHKITGKSPIREKKQEYISVSGLQRDNICEHAKAKLLALTYEGLLTQIDKLIGESERFFERLPEVLNSLKGEGDTLRTKHDGNAEPAIAYVLGESKYKDLLYKEEINTLGTVFFPEDMSAQIYRSMFDKTFDAIEMSHSTIEMSKQQREELWKEELENDLKVFKDVLKDQEDKLRKESELAKMNVIKALRKEAELNIPSTAVNYKDKRNAYMQKRFHNLSAMSVTRGADNIDTRVNRPINSWGIHPECIDPLTLSQEECLELFGDSDIATNPLNAASREVSPLFSKFEIVRADSIHLLELSKNFMGFIDVKTNAYAQGNTGVYYKAYSNLIDRIVTKDSKAYSPHLDKRWHMPSYMPNIGETMNETLHDIFRALYSGLLFERLKVKADKGNYYWYGISAVSDYLKDLEGKRVSVKGMSVAMSINMLFEAALANDPKTVATILNYSSKEWEKAREAWMNVSSKSVETMKNQPVVKKILGFAFSKVFDASSWSDDKYDFFYMIGDQNVKLLAKNVGKLRNLVFNDLMSHFIETFDASSDTYKLCKYVFGNIKDNMLKSEALAVLEQAKDDGLFEPK